MTLSRLLVVTLLLQCLEDEPCEPVDPRVRLAIARWPDDAPRGSVTTFCLEHDLSRKTFSAIRKRAQQGGPGGSASATHSPTDGQSEPNH